MNVLKKLTKKNLTLNKKRTIVTIIGIMLSTALIVCVSGLVGSFQKTLVNEAIDSNGNYHALIKDMNKEEAESLKNNRNIKDLYTMSNLGYAKIDSKNENKPFLFIKSYDDSALKNMAIKLTSGRLPTNDSELIISNHFLNDTGLDLKINDTITLDIGNRYIMEDGKKYYLNQKNPYSTQENAETEFDEAENTYEKEEFEKVRTKTYTIVGIMKRPNYSVEGYSAPGYTCITYLNENIDKKDIAILYKNAKDYDDKTIEIAKDIYEYSYNSELLRWLGVTDSMAMGALRAVEAIVIGIIIISSVFVIRNSFAISITEKKKAYGMFKSVGATSKQIKKNVLYEGLILGIFAIPIGILAGTLATFLLCVTLNLILGDLLEEIKFAFNVPITGILLSTALASLTIYLSVIFTAKKAGKISPINAIRGNDDIKIKNKKLKTPKIIHKIFKTGGVIAYKNLKRNKKKYRTTVISIVVSVFVFISLSSFIDMAFKAAGMYYKDLSYNLEISPNVDLEAEEQEELLTQVSKDSLITRFSIQKQANFTFKSEEYLSDFGKNIKEVYQYEDNDLAPSIISVGQEEFNRLLEANHLNVAENQDKGLLLDEYQDYINKKLHTGDLYDIKNKTKITGQVHEYNSKDGKIENQKEISIEIINITKRPMGLENVYYTGGYLVVSDDYFNKNFTSHYTRMFVKSKDAQKLEKNIEEMTKENNVFKKLSVYNLEEQIKQEKSMILIISIFLYGFITVITLIGITNIFNTITTNMNLRSKEFAMLKSIGMTKKEFNKMIRLESIFYGSKALFFGIPLGLIGSYLIYKAFNDGLAFGYIFPLKAILLAILFVLVIIGIIMKYSLNKINKQNIIETIRNDNI